MRPVRFPLLTLVVLVGVVYAGIWNSTQLQDELRYTSGAISWGARP